MGRPPRFNCHDDEPDYLTGGYMKKHLLLMLILLLLLVACATSPATIDVPDVRRNTACTDGDSIWLTPHIRYCEFNLDDGTRCVLVHTGSYRGGTGLTCDWEQ